MIILLDGTGLAKKVTDLLGLTNVIRSIDPHTLSDDDERMQKLLNVHFVYAVHELEQPTMMPNSDAPWLEWLKNNWQKLLPIVDFPVHDWESYDHDLGYTASPAAQRYVIFEQVAEAYDYRSKEDYSEMILDNDVRALFYEYLSRTFDWMIHDKASSPEHYLGGCLRTPMLLARAKFAAAKLKSDITVLSLVAI